MPPASIASQLLGRALTDGQTYARVAELTDRVGPRLSGSAGAAAGVQWALERFKADGVKAHLEAVRVPHWVRGVETAELLASPGYILHPLAVTALGMSPGTGPDGVTAEVVEVSSLGGLEKLGEQVRGKIVFFNHAMKVAEDYGPAARLRGQGPAQAAKQGAVGAVIRSLSTASLRTPHTGTTQFGEGAPRVPAAALAVEDAQTLHRALQRGVTRMHLTLGCQLLPDVDSHNVVAEIRGREKPDEVVVLGAHLDSWDLATGAEDDAAGVAMVMETAQLLAQLKPAPRRTVRVVLFMNEENGLRGGLGYAQAHARELAKHVAALEADSGGGRPLGITATAGKGAEALLTAWMKPLETLGSAHVVEGEAGGADVHPLMAALVPMVGIRQDTSHYFDFHHSAADTLDIIRPEELAASAGAYAWLTYALAEAPTVLPRLEKTAPAEKR